MPWNKKSLIFYILIALTFSACSMKNNEVAVMANSQKSFEKVETKSFELEDFYIMYALEMENQRVYIEARDIYLNLFQNTNKYEYLVNFLSISTQLKDYASVENIATKYYKANIKEEEIILRLNAFSKFKLDKLEDAKKHAEKLVGLYKNGINYELLGTIYLAGQEYQKAYTTFEEVLKFDTSSNIMQTITNIQFYHLEEKEEAIKRLEEFIPQNEYDFNISLQLVTFYETLKKNMQLEAFLKSMFYFYKNSDDQSSLNKTKALFWKDVNKENLISFWEANNENDEVLLNAYRVTNQPEKAYNLLKVLYENSSSVDYLAQQAIIEFEMASDKKAVAPSVIAKLEEVLKSSQNHVYQNFLAYLLIDYDYDVKKGLILVKKALEQDAKNIAYLDTLAWGEYKSNNCKEAYFYMKQIVDEIGLEDDEIKLHWEKIKECQQ